MGTSSLCRAIQALAPNMEPLVVMRACGYLRRYGKDQDRDEMRVDSYGDAYFAPARDATLLPVEAVVEQVVFDRAPLDCADIAARALRPRDAALIGRRTVRGIIQCGATRRRHQCRREATVQLQQSEQRVC